LIFEDTETEPDPHAANLDRALSGRIRREVEIEKPLKLRIAETRMAVTTEIAPNPYRISIFAERGNLQFNHFLVKDDEPLLFHTGLRGRLKAHKPF
jgi:hypothetical protein